MNVTMLAHTPTPERVCAIAARTCYSPETPSQIAQSITDDEIGRVLARCVSSGHLSVLEHASFTFAVDGISRACSHQLVRHRLASYSQQSQRYTDPTEDIDWYTWPSNMSSEAKRAFTRAAVEAEVAYEAMMDSGVSAEDARYILPNATRTNLVMTMNARELRHFFSLRCCRRAQWEIRALAWAIRDLCVDVAPLLFEGSGPGCMTGGCTEAEPCGEPYGGER